MREEGNKEEMMATLHERMVRAGETALHVIEGGGHGGLDIVLLHGMKFQAATWKELGTVDLLAERGHHALAIDLPGFGGSPASSRTHDEVLADFLRHAGLQRPVLIGPSMGGRVALEFCLGHPDLLRGLVLVGAVGVEENRDRLAHITVPTLIVWGGEDAVSPLKNGELLARQIAGSSIFIIDGAPHPCYLDQPDTWHRTVLEFLDALQQKDARA